MAEAAGKRGGARRKKAKESDDGGLLQPLFSKSVVDRIIEQITEAIIDRKLLPGKKIPTEMELCALMGVGRNSVREAIKVLVTMGVLEIRRSEGTFVTAGFSERMLDPIIYGLILEGGDTFDLLELRVVFETGVFRYATEKRNDADIENLKTALATMEATVAAKPNPKAVLESDIRFHRVVAGMIGNPLIDKVGLVLERLSLPRRMEAIRMSVEQDDLDRLVNRHSAMLQVIQGQDIGAVDGVINEHFRNWRSGRISMPAGRKPR